MNMDLLEKYLIVNALAGIIRLDRIDEVLSRSEFNRVVDIRKAIDEQYEDAEQFKTMCDMTRKRVLDLIEEFEKTAV